jgi:hypothetical protein
MVEAIGLRMAHEASVAEGVPGPLCDIFLAAALKADACWFSGYDVMPREVLADLEAKAFEAAEPEMPRWVDDMGVGDYVRAPIVDEGKWKSFVQLLEEFAPARQPTVDEGEFAAVYPDLRDLGYADSDRHSMKGTSLAATRPSLRKARL